MKLIKAKVNWGEGYANSPSLDILVDKMPDLNDLRHRRKGNLYYAELDGYVDFFSYTSPDRGFGGRTFNITMENGEKKALHGPWSSRASVMNSVGFGPCIDVGITESPQSYERGYTFYSGHVTVNLIENSKHLVEVGPGYNQKCGSGCVKKDECFIEFPKGSVFTFLKQTNLYNPAVLFPDGSIWTKGGYNI